jgi:hypothetical protein
MAEQHDEQRVQAIRRADAMTNAATRLIDDEQAHPDIDEHYPGFWSDIREHVIPLLEAEARKARV